MKYKEILTKVKSRTSSGSEKETSPPKVKIRSQDTFKVMKKFTFTDVTIGRHLPHGGDRGKAAKFWKISPNHPSKLMVLAFDIKSGDCVVIDYNIVKSKVKKAALYKYFLVKKEELERALEEEALEFLGNFKGDFLKWIEKDRILNYYPDQELFYRSPKIYKSMLDRAIEGLDAVGFLYYLKSEIFFFSNRSLNFKY